MTKALKTLVLCVHKSRTADALFCIQNEASYAQAVAFIKCISTS